MHLFPHHYFQEIYKILFRSFKFV